MGNFKTQNKLAFTQAALDRFGAVEELLGRISMGVSPDAKDFEDDPFYGQRLDGLKFFIRAEKEVDGETVALTGAFVLT